MRAPGATAAARDAVAVMLMIPTVVTRMKPLELRQFRSPLQLTPRLRDRVRRYVSGEPALSRLTELAVDVGYLGSDAPRSRPAGLASPQAPWPQGPQVREA